VSPERHIHIHIYSISSCIPAVLVPGLDLRVGEAERRRQVHAVLHAQVLLALEAALELVELVVREGRARLAGLLGARRGAVPAARDLPLALLLGACKGSSHARYLS